MSHTKKTEKILIIAGLIFILIGIICNQWLLTSTFSSDGHISSIIRVMIWILDFVLIGIGVFLIYFRKRPEMLRNLLLMSCTLFICLVITEFVFRQFEEKETKVRVLIENPNNTGSYRLKPNSVVNIKSKGHNFLVKINSHGMHWKEVDIRKKANIIRIAFLGDSFTFGASADRIENSFVGIFDSIMGSHKYEVLNFGVGGYGLGDMKLQIKEKILVFEPDYIIMMVFNGNDFRDTYLGINKFIIRNGIADWDKKVVSKKIPKKYSASEYLDVKNRLKLFILNLATMKRIRRFLEKPDKTGEFVKEIDFRVDNIFRSYSFWSQKNYPEVSVKARKITLETLHQIQNICKANGIEIIVITIPFEQQVYSKALSGEDYDIKYPQHYIEEFCKQNSIPYLSLLPILRAYIREQNSEIYFAEDIHFNNIGHNFVGKTIANFFQEILQQHD